MTMEYIILEYRLSSEIDFSSLTYFSCLVKKKLPAACRGRAGQRGRPCTTIVPAAGRPPNLFGERDHIQEEMHYITEEMAAEFAAALGQREYSQGTVENYLRSLRRFAAWSGGAASRSLAAGWKAFLAGRCAPATVNAMLAGINCFFAWRGWEECRVKPLRLQRRSFQDPERELSREDYRRLVQTARARGLSSGPVFRTRSGRPLSRTQIWAEMKQLCQAAGVTPSRVFPHNLRHLFARAFYALCRDIVKLADVLGHSSIDTTRIYLRTTGAEHVRQLERLHLLC